jgi:Transglycosylase SLT domain
MCFCAVVAATMFPTLAFSGPQQVSQPQTEPTEASVVQLPPGARLHSARHSQTLATPHPQPVSATPPAALKKMAEDAAAAHTLPANYFLRLIRQESGFDPNSVSPAGAQGIAQFMPATASNRGLKDPFDPAEALPKSAELLSELKDHFGNLGLAAAAYNAGPERIRKWLAGQSPLPEETVNYVRVITGHDIADWAKSNNLTIDLAADAIELPRAHFNRLSWEAQLLATLQATSTNTTATSTSTSTTVSTDKLIKASHRSSEASLCSGCIVQSAY